MSYILEELSLLQDLVKANKHLVYDPTIEDSSLTKLKLDYTKPTKKIYDRVEIVDLHLDERQKSILRDWLISTTEMYNATVDHLNKCWNNLKNFVIDKKDFEFDDDDRNHYSDLRMIYKESFKWKIVRTYYLRDIRDEIQLNSNGLGRKFSKENLVYTHVLDAAIKQCCASYITMVKNYKNGHTGMYHLRHLSQTRRYKILEMDPLYISNKNSDFHKDLGEFISLRDGKNYDLTEVKRASLIRYDREKDKFQLLVPIKENVVRERKTNKFISIDPGVRSPLYCLIDNDSFPLGEPLADKIYDEIIKVENFCKRKRVKSKVKRKHKKRAKRRIKNMVTNFHWESANFIAKSSRVVLMGDIDVKSIISKENKTLSKRIKKVFAHLRFGEFKNKLKYKCEANNTAFYLVREKYTSKVCSFCGWYHEHLKKLATFNCESCLKVINRDSNACRNIMIKSLDWRLRRQ